jgi:hypothetical protein
MKYSLQSSNDTSFVIALYPGTSDVPCLMKLNQLGSTWELSDPAKHTDRETLPRICARTSVTSARLVNSQRLHVHPV